MHNLATESARPLTDDERKAADRDNTNVGERVYAPASERVPRTVPGYGDLAEHTDTHTPEREAAGWTQPQTGTMANEPSFTRVERPASDFSTSSNSMDDSNEGWQPNRWMSNTSSNNMMPMMIGWGSLGVCAGVGVWLWMRWRRERNKPINRIRRQAYALRDRMPEMPEFPEEATRPAIGLGTALIGVAALLLQQYQARSRSTADEMKHRGDKLSSRMGKISGRAEKMSRRGTKMSGKMSRKAAQNMADMDWQERLMRLKDRWTPDNIDLERISIPKR